MKKVLWILLPILMLSLTAVSASAAQYVYDNADVLTDTEEASLNTLAEQESKKHGISITVLTEKGIDDDELDLYAANFYDYGGFSENGVILFLEMTEKDWCLVTSGSMEEAIGDYEFDYMEDHVIPWLSDQNYGKGFEQYIIIASALCDYAKNNQFTGTYVLDDYSPDSGVGPVYYAVAFGVSLLIAFLVCNGFKNQLDTAVRKSAATDYFRTENANITHSADRFLYSRTTKIRKSTDNNSGGKSGGSTRSFSGSSGRSHTSRSGKF